MSIVQGTYLRHFLTRWHRHSPQRWCTMYTQSIYDQNSCIVWGSVHVYPDIFESANFWSRSLKICASTRSRIFDQICSPTHIWYSLQYQQSRRKSQLCLRVWWYIHRLIRTLHRSFFILSCLFRFYFWAMCHNRDRETKEKWFLYLDWIYMRLHFC